MAAINYVDGSFLKTRPLVVPPWIYETDIILRPVRLTPTALEALECILAERGRGQTRNAKKKYCCVSVSDAVALISQVLRQDIRGVHQGRAASASASTSCVSKAAVASPATIINAEGAHVDICPPTINNNTIFECKLDDLLVEFLTLECDIEVFSIAKIIEN